MGAGGTAYWELKVVAIREVRGSFLVVATEQIARSIDGIP
jgi:hypothetical protein